MLLKRMKKANPETKKWLAYNPANHFLYANNTHLYPGKNILSNK